MCLMFQFPEVFGSSYSKLDVLHVVLDEVAGGCVSGVMAQYCLQVLYKLGYMWVLDTKSVGAECAIQQSIGYTFLNIHEV